MQYTANINVFSKSIASSVTSSLSPSQSYDMSQIFKSSTDIVVPAPLTFDALKTEIRSIANIPSGSVFEEEVLKLPDAPNSLVYSGSMVVEYTNPYYRAILRAYSGSVSVDPEPTGSSTTAKKKKSK